MPYGGSAAKVTIAEVQSEFLQALQAQEDLAGLIADTKPSTRKSEKFVVVGSPSILQEWTDERVDQDVFETDLTVTPRHYEAMEKVHRDSLEDDQTGAYMENVRGLAGAVVLHRNNLVLGDLLDAMYSDGNYGLAWDGQFFFDTDHSDPGPATYTTSWDNDLTGAAATGTTPTEAEVHTALDAIEEAFMLKKDDKGRPYHGGALASLPRVIVAPPDLYGPIVRAVNNTWFPVSGGPIENVNRKGLYRVVANQYTANADRFQVFLGTKAALIVQRLAARFQQVTGMRSGEVSHETFIRLFDYFGVDYRIRPALRHFAYACSYIYT